ncbi:MAG: CBS domain-containing protein [Chloroflexales bacterium]|nr:CBS domain-containing protein [Chloroflexales bacterium]
MQVRDIMARDVTSFPPAATIMEIAGAMRSLNVGSVPIVDEDEQLVGIITDRDIVLRVVADGLDAQSERVAAYMTLSPTTAAPNWSLEQAAQAMARDQVRRLPVVENGQLVGYVSIGDVALQDKDDTVGDAIESISAPDNL